MSEDYLLLALSDPLPGREAEYNAWYDGRHVADLLAIPGIEAAERYELALPLNTPDPYGYLAMYRIRTADIAAVLAAIGERAGTDAMPMSPALGPRVYAGAYRLRPPADADR